MIKEHQAELQTKYNIDAFILNNPSKEDIALLRLATRFRDNNIIEKLKTKGVIKSSDHKHNLIANVGKSVFARLLAGDNTYTGELTHGALGTGTNPPASSDTTLETETFRKEISSSAIDGNTAYIDIFIDQAETSGTFTEFGNFIDGTASANSGQLFSHVAVNWVKTLTDSLFIACKYQFV